MMQFGDIIEKGATSIPEEVLEFQDADGDRARRNADCVTWDRLSFGSWRGETASEAVIMNWMYYPLTVLKVAEPTPPSPLVLSLPEVPKSAVLHGARTEQPWMWSEAFQLWVSPTDKRNLGDLIHFEGSVTVETAPPREPRTWSKIDSVDDEPERVTVSGQGAWHRDADAGAYTHDTEPVGFYSLIDLREMGDVTEVLD